MKPKVKVMENVEGEITQHYLDVARVDMQTSCFNRLTYLKGRNFSENLILRTTKIIFFAFAGI